MPFSVLMTTDKEGPIREKVHIGATDQMSDCLVKNLASSRKSQHIHPTSANVLDSSRAPSQRYSSDIVPLKVINTVISTLKLMSAQEHPHTLQANMSLLRLRAKYWSTSPIFRP